MKRRIIAACFATLAAAAVAAPAAAEMKTALTANELMVRLDKAGIPSAKMIEDVDTGAPVASVKAGGVDYWIRALDCAGSPKACSTLMFFANFELGRDATQKDFEIINRYNEKQVFGRAYVIPGRKQVGVDYVIELDGGVSDENISRNIARWTDVINAFIANFRNGADIS